MINREQRKNRPHSVTDCDAVSIEWAASHFREHFQSSIRFNAMKLILYHFVGIKSAVRIQTFRASDICSIAHSTRYSTFIGRGRWWRWQLYKNENKHAHAHTSVRRCHFDNFATLTQSTHRFQFCFTNCNQPGISARKLCSRWGQSLASQKQLSPFCNLESLPIHRRITSVHSMCHAHESMRKQCVAYVLRRRKNLRFVLN